MPRLRSHDPSSSAQHRIPWDYRHVFISTSTRDLCILRKKKKQQNKPQTKKLHLLKRSAQEMCLHRQNRITHSLKLIIKFMWRPLVELKAWGSIRYVAWWNASVAILSEECSCGIGKKESVPLTKGWDDRMIAYRNNLDSTCECNRKLLN